MVAGETLFLIPQDKSGGATGSVAWAKHQRTGGDWMSASLAPMQEISVNETWSECEDTPVKVEGAHGLMCVVWGTGCSAQAPGVLLVAPASL